MLPSRVQHHERLVMFASVFFICSNENCWIAFAKINMVHAIVKNQNECSKVLYQQGFNAVNRTF